MQITFDEEKKLDTNPIFHLFVQGENMAESIRIVGPKMVGALDLSQLRMAVRVTSAAYETMVEKTLEQTDAEEDTITLVWNVDKQFTSNPGHVHVMLVGYGNNEEVIKITSSGIEIKEDETFVSAPQGSTWDQILRKMQDLATQAQNSQTAAAESATSAAASEKVAISKAEEIENAAEQTAANAKAAAQSAQEAAESAASIDPSKLVKSVNGEPPVDGAVSVTTRNLAYQVGDTITTTDAGFDPNASVGGTWTKNAIRSLYKGNTNVELYNGATATNAIYCVVNGICFIMLNRINVKVPGEPFAVNLPKCKLNMYFTVNSGQTIYMGNDTPGYTDLRCTGTTVDQFAPISYPVDDTALETYYIWTKTA